MKMRYKNNHNWINTKFWIYQKNNYVAKPREIWNSGLKISEITDTSFQPQCIFAKGKKRDIFFWKIHALVSCQRGKLAENGEDFPYSIDVLSLCFRPVYII